MKYWSYLSDFFNGTYLYNDVLREIKPHLTKGQVTVRGKTWDESRMTCYFSLFPGVMKYSGRTLSHNPFMKNSLVKSMIQCFNDENFLNLKKQQYPELSEYFTSSHAPNAVFINYYRPISETNGKPDGIGYHTDDLKDHESPIIFSYTLCEEGAEALFRFRKKPKKTSFEWEKEINNDCMLIMKPGCQKQYWHQVGKRKTKLDRTKFKGGRINITFRKIKIV